MFFNYLVSCRHTCQLHFKQNPKTLGVKKWSDSSNGTFLVTGLLDKDLSQVIYHLLISKVLYFPVKCSETGIPVEKYGCVSVYERDPGIITKKRNDQMGQHRPAFGPKETHTEPASEHMVSIFQCSDRFTPLPLCLLYHCLSELIGRLCHMLAEPAA